MLCVPGIYLICIEGCGLMRVSMSAEKIFQCGSSTFLFAFLALFLVLYGVLGSVFAGLA